MIVFDRVSESNDLRTEAHKERMGVMPGSDTQVTDMIKLVYGEFNKAHREAMLEPYDKLLGEVYDVSEDDISIDYEVSDQVKEILTDFKFVNTAKY